MKTKLLIIAWLIGVCGLISCEKAEDTLPKLEVVDDVCTKMDDINFMKYCYDNFDVNKDGKVSMAEANAVKEISGFDNSSLLKVVSYAGIEYFSNLEIIRLGRYDTEPQVKTMDLSYNKCLASISLTCATHISSLDLRFNNELEYVDMEGCAELTTIYLPKSIESIPALAFYRCAKLSVVDMSQCINLSEIRGGSSYRYTFPSNIDVFLIGATVPPETSNYSMEFESIKTLKVPSGSVEDYKKSSWKHYALEIKPIEKKRMPRMHTF